MRILYILKAFVPYGFIWLYEKLKKRLKKAEKPSKSTQTNEDPDDAVRALQLILFEDHPCNFYGQGAEDLLLRIFSDYDKKDNGFYVDIGAFHPLKASNTKYFYDRGWSGINIDANPTYISEFNKVRDRDINIEIGIADEAGELDFYFFGADHSINTFSKEKAIEFEKTFNLPIEEIRKVPVKPINDILKEFLPKGQHIDFISMDVEGMEMQILRSLDFEKYAPDFFLVEDLGSEGGRFRNAELNNLKMSEQNRFLEEKGYVAVGKTILTILYKKRK